MVPTGDAASQGFHHAPDQALEAARTLDEVAAAHGAFLGAATRAAMVAKERTWVLVIQAVRRLLDLALRCADITRVTSSCADLTC